MPALMSNQKQDTLKDLGQGKHLVNHTTADAQRHSDVSIPCYLPTTIMLTISLPLTTQDPSGASSADKASSAKANVQPKPLAAEVARDVAKVTDASLPPPVPGPDMSMTIVGSKLPPIRESNGAMVTYVLANGTHYKIKIKNNGSVRVQATLFIDGTNTGALQYEPGVDYVPLERPVDVAKKFTFYTIRAVRAAESAVAAAAQKIQSAEPATAGEGRHADAQMHKHRHTCMCTSTHFVQVKKQWPRAASNARRGRTWSSMDLSSWWWCPSKPSASACLQPRIASYASTRE